MLHSNRRLLTTITAAGILAAVASACSASNSTTSAATNSQGNPATTAAAACPDLPPETNVTIAAGTSLAYPMLYMAQQEGYFADNHLNVTIKTVSDPATQLQLVNSGQVDAAYTGFSGAFFNGVSEGLSMRGVASEGQYPEGVNQAANFFVRTDLITSGTVKAAADLKGLTVGLQGGSAGLSNAGGYFLALLLKSGGLTLSDVTIKNVAITDTDAAFKSKAIDFSFMPSPFSALVEQDDSARVFGPANLLAHQTQGGLVFGSKLDQSDPQVGRAFLRALLRVVPQLQGNYTSLPAYKKAMEDNGIPASLVASSPPYYFDPDLAWNASTVSEFQSTFIQYGHGTLRYSSPLPFTSVTNDAMRQTAVSELAKCGQ